MVGFEQLRADFDAIGVSLVCASVDSVEKAKEVADEVSFPVGHGVSRSIADTLGSWWEDQRQIIQPSEFILDANNTVRASSYSDGPLGRMLGPDALSLIRLYQSRE